MARRGGEDEVKQLTVELSKTLKDGERILALTRRPDGTLRKPIRIRAGYVPQDEVAIYQSTLRKPIRIRAGYVPQDEVAIYQSKGALWKKEMESQEVLPPGYDPVLDAKPKTKSSKRNERKKEKRLLASLEKGKTLDKDEVSSAEDVNQAVPIEAVASQLNEFTISANSSAVSAPSNSTEYANSKDPVPDIDKKIRALKKKIRLTEAQQQKSVQELKPEQLDKLAKLEGWCSELKLLEDKKADLAAL